jgi:chorismate synthase
VTGLHRFLTGGESHGPCLTVIIEGMPAGLPIDEAAINADLVRRQGGYGRGGRMRIEKDAVETLGGVHNGLSTGGPIVFRIENRDFGNQQKRKQPRLTAPRPGHADLVGATKYRLPDMRIALERSSARETAARVAAGAVARALLAQFGIAVGSFVESVGSVTAAIPDGDPAALLEATEASEMRCPDPAATAAMRALVDEARRSGNTLGGVFTVWATGVPVGLGSYTHYDRRLDGRLAGAVMSIQAIKGVEIGPAFENATRFGRDVHDQIYAGPAGPYRRANRSGGLEGGVTTGLPLVIRAAMKPISTTINPLTTVDMATGQETPTTYQRSDFCAVPAAGVVGEAMVAWVLAEALHEKLGGDSLAEMLERWPALPATPRFEPEPAAPESPGADG